jgi:hypothetical protein
MRAATKSRGSKWRACQRIRTTSAGKLLCLAQRLPTAHLFTSVAAILRMSPSEKAAARLRQYALRHHMVYRKHRRRRGGRLAVLQRPAGLYACADSSAGWPTQGGIRLPCATTLRTIGDMNLDPILGHRLFLDSFVRSVFTDGGERYVILMWCRPTCKF